MNFLSREPSCMGKAHLLDKGILTQISSGYKPTNTEVEGVQLFATLALLFFFLPATFHDSAPLAQIGACASAGLFHSAPEAASRHLPPPLKGVVSHQNEEGTCHEFQQEKEDTSTSSPAAGGNHRQFGGVTSQGSGKVCFLALPCPFAAAGSHEKYPSIFGLLLCCFLDASHQVSLVLLTNHTATATERESTHLRAYLIPDALFPLHTM